MVKPNHQTRLSERKNPFFLKQNSAVSTPAVHNPRPLKTGNHRFRTLKQKVHRTPYCARNTSCMRHRDLLSQYRGFIGIRHTLHMIIIIWSGLRQQFLQSGYRQVRSLQYWRVQGRCQSQATIHHPPAWHSRASYQPGYSGRC